MARYAWPQIAKGDNYKLVVTVTDLSTGAAVNLTGASVSWEMYLNGSSAYTRATGGSGITITNAAGGILEVDGATSTLAFGTYQSALTITDTSSRISTVYRVDVSILNKY